MAQLTLSGERTHSTLTLEIPRGDTKTIEGTDATGVDHDLQASEIQYVSFTVRDSSDTAVVQLTTDAHSSQFDYSTDYKLKITLEKEDTEGLSLTESYTYGIEIIDNSDRVYTPYTGVFSLIDDVVYDDATASYLTRTPRSAFESLMAGLLACVNATQTSAAAASGASAIVVDTPGIFTASDSIVIELDGGTREKHDIATIVSSTINLDGTTLGDTVAADNVVIRVG